MNMMNINGIDSIEPPKRPMTDLEYETDLKAALEPALSNLLDRTESAGWNRRKAAYAAMVLAAKNITASNAPSDDGSFVS